MLKNQLKATRHVTKITAAWASRIPRRVLDRLNEEQASAIDADYGELTPKQREPLQEQLIDLFVRAGEAGGDLWPTNMTQKRVGVT